MKIGVVSKQEIPYELFENLIVTALEGGSNYWAMLDVERSEKGFSKYQNQPLSVAIANMIWYDSYTLRVMDSEEDDVLLGEVNMLKVKDAFQKLASERADVYSRIIQDEWDADDSDIFFQFCTMGSQEFA